MSPAVFGWRCGPFSLSRDSGRGPGEGSRIIGAPVLKQQANPLDVRGPIPHNRCRQHERPTPDFAWPPSPFALQVRVSIGRIPMIGEPSKPHGRVCSVPPGRAREPAKCEPAERAFLVLFCLPALMLFRLSRAVTCLFLLPFSFLIQNAHAQIQQAWVAKYNNGILNGTNQAVKMVLDSSGNIYVTGLSQNTNTNLGYVTIKYAPNGNETWATRFDSTNYPTATPSGFALDSNHNVVVTGSALTVKYDTNGNQLWT